MNECTEVQNPWRHHMHRISMHAIRGKMADRMYGFQQRECWISAMEQFQRKPHKFFDLRCLCDSIFRTNRRSRVEMWLNRHTHTHRQSNYGNPPVHARRFYNSLFLKLPLAPRVTYAHFWDHQAIQQLSSLSVWYKCISQVAHHAIDDDSMKTKSIST